MRLRTMLLVVVLLLSSVGAAWWTASTVAADVACGLELRGHGEGYRTEMRDCLWQAWQEGRRAWLASTAYGIEGGERTQTIRVAGPGLVELYTGERPSPQARLTVCQGLEQVAYADEPGRYGFRLTGCGGGTHEITTP